VKNKVAKNQMNVQVERSSFIDEGDGVVSFPGGLTITDNTLQRNGTRYDIDSMDVSKYGHQLTSDHEDKLENLIGEVIGVTKDGYKVTIDKIRYAINESASGRLAYDLLTGGFSKNFSIETIGMPPDENGVYWDAELVGLSQVVTQNNYNASLNQLVHNSLESSKKAGLDIDGIEEAILGEHSSTVKTNNEVEGAVHTLESNEKTVQVKLKVDTTEVENAIALTKELNELIQETSVENSVPASKTLPLADKSREWDSSMAEKRVRAWATGENDKLDFKKYGKAFFYYTPDDAGTLGAYKLPFADIVDGELVAVWRGVAASMAALNGARGGLDVPDSERQGIYNAIKVYYKKFKETPPSLAKNSVAKDDVEINKQENKMDEDKKVETPAVEEPKVETPVVEAPKEEVKVEEPVAEAPNVEEAPKVEEPKVEQPTVDQNALAEAVKNAVAEVTTGLKADFDKQLESAREEAKNAFDTAAQAPKFKKEETAKVEKTENKYTKMSSEERYDAQVSAAWNAIKGNSLPAWEELRQINEVNLEAGKEKGIYRNSMTLADIGNFVISPELYTTIVGVRNDYTALLSATNWTETDSISFAWTERVGDINMQNVAFCDDGEDGNLKPISEYGTVVHTEDLEELAAVSVVCTAATRFAAVDLLQDVAQGYRTDYDRKRAQLVIAKLEQAVDATGNSVPYAPSNDANALTVWLQALTEISDTTLSGTLIFNARTFAELKARALRAGVNGPLAEILTGGGIPTIFGMPFIVVPNDLLPSLGGTDSVTVQVNGQNVVINHAVFYADLTQFRGRTSGGLQYDISSQASYEDGGVVKSAYQRNELVLRGSFFRGGAFLDRNKVAGIRQGTANVS